MEKIEGLSHLINVTSVCDDGEKLHSSCKNKHLYCLTLTVQLTDCHVSQRSTNKLQTQLHIHIDDLTKTNLTKDH